MTTSGSTDFNVTRSNIISDALMIIGAVGAEETVQAADDAIAARILNSMIKAWQAQGMHLWARQEAALFLTSGTAEYTLDGSATGADASDSVVVTTLSADEATAQTVLSVTSSAGMTAADIVLIELDDGTYEDTTIVSVDSATQITVTDALTSGASSANKVYSYTTRMGRPLDIESIRFRSDSGIDRTLNRISREEYFDLPNKSSTGQPVSFYYSPKLGEGKLYLWPTPDRIDYHLRLTYNRSFEDMDTPGNTPDFPQEWLEALTYNLALRLAPMFGKDQKAITMLAGLAQNMLADVAMGDNENSSMSFIPDRRFD